MFQIILTVKSLLKMDWGKLAGWQWWWHRSMKLLRSSWELSRSNDPKRKTKNELSSLPSQDLLIQQYQGPKNHSVPKLETTPSILLFYVLAKAALSHRRANDSNLHFLRFLGNGFEIPEYSSFNTQFAREADVRLHPATHVTYMSLINMNPEEPDIMLTTMKLVKSQSEQARQEHSVFTNDQQLFKIATQIPWHKPDEWKDFFPILGGMHTLMLFVECIRTLIASTGLSDMLKSIFGSVEKHRFPANIFHRIKNHCAYV